MATVRDGSTVMKAKAINISQGGLRVESWSDLTIGSNGGGVTARAHTGSRASEMARRRPLWPGVQPDPVDHAAGGLAPATATGARGLRGDPDEAAASGCWPASRAPPQASKPCFAAASAKSSTCRSPQDGIPALEAGVEFEVARHRFNIVLEPRAVEDQRSAFAQYPAGTAQQPERGGPRTDVDHIDAENGIRASDPPVVARSVELDRRLKIWQR